MNRRTLLTSMTLLGLAIVALPQVGFAQSNLTGTWQLNLAKTKYSPGPPPKSSTLYFQGGKLSVAGIDAAGNLTGNGPLEFTDDGKPNPVTGNPAYDANARTRVDAYTLNTSRTKAGKVVQTGTNVISRDGKMMTITVAGSDANGRQINNVSVYDKQ